MRRINVQTTMTMERMLNREVVSDAFSRTKWEILLKSKHILLTGV